jgi:hypothetical protein
MKQFCDTPLRVNYLKRIFPKIFLCILIFGLNLHAINTIRIYAFEYSVVNRQYYQGNYLNSISSREVEVDIFTEKEGRGSNASIGTYRIGDTIKVFIFVSHNCTIKIDLITPDSSIWNLMYGPIQNGTIIEYIDAQYPVGKWILSVKIEDKNSAYDTATFEVIEKEAYTKTHIHELRNIGTIEEARFSGKVVRVHHYPVGGVYGWDILVTKTDFGLEVTNHTILTRLFDIARLPDSPPGYLDATITLGDQVEVYGLLTQKDGEIFVSLNGFENYYIKTLKTIYESPELILFTKEVPRQNFTVRIDGIAIPGSQNVSITNINWNWGDGQSLDQEFPATHTYSKSGSYVIVIKAFQSDGLSTAKSLSISVPKNISSNLTNTTVTGILNEPNPHEEFSMTEKLWTTFLVAIITIFVSILIIRSRIKKKLSTHEI